MRRGKYSLFPLLSSFYRKLEQDGRKDQTGEAMRVRARDNPALVEALIEDGFAFTELGSSDLELQHFLTHNKRYRIGADVFFEMHQILLREAERRLRENERAFTSRVARHLPGLPRDEQLRPAGLSKIVMNGHVLAYLLADAWTTGAKLQASPLLRAEAEKRKAAEFVDAFMDFLSGLRRFEVLSAVRDRVKLLEPGRELDLTASRGVRLYEFGEATQILNHVVNATVLFLDLRGFTKTSEGQISERDLTRELYAVFDAFVPHIRRFGGRVDKFLGDGMMVTFGTDQTDPLDPQSALRAAILCQETLERQRQAGKTYFKMGIATPLRAGLSGAVHRRRGYGGPHGDRTQREPGRSPELRGQEAHRGRRERRAPLPPLPETPRACTSASIPPARSSTRASPSAATCWCSSRTTCPSSTAKA